MHYILCINFLFKTEQYSIDPFPPLVLFPTIYSLQLCACAFILPRREEVFMEVRASERRVTRRHQIKTALQLRVWKSGPTELRVQSLDLSEKGASFATDAPIPIGSAVEILLKMPEEITGRPTTEWRCSGRVVRVQPVDAPQGKLGIGVEFDYYEILRSKNGNST